jgi:ligand-binding sensor protein
MNLYEVLPREKWIEIEAEINSRSRLNASVFDADGKRITDFKKWANRLCPAVKTNENGQRFICAAAHQVIALKAAKSKQPVVEECDAGLMKLAVPIFVNDEFMGVAGGCGLLKEDGKVDAYLVHKNTGIELKEVESLADDLETIGDDKIHSIIAYIEDQLNQIVKDFTNPGISKA